MVYPSVIECLLGAGAPKLKRHCPAIEVQSMRVASDPSTVLDVMEHVLRQRGRRRKRTPIVLRFSSLYPNHLHGKVLLNQRKEKGEPQRALVR